MSLYCKNCGSEISIIDGQKIVVCDFCGMEQTVPTPDDPQKLELFVKANEYRSACRFDVAKKQYESIIAKYPDDNEAYWCKLLCEYGIEYVDDDLTEKKLPTCHRTVMQSIFDNKDYKLIMSRATVEEKAIYEAEAKEIDRIQKEIIEKANQEEPYDVFICYKESDENGRRTRDSQIANRIHANLTSKGYKVFFSRVTLKELAGKKYEPIIYSALISAKVMLVVTTSKDYVNAPWVRNEWSRFLEFMQSDYTKSIVPCISVIDAYDLPEELAEFQALNTADMDFTENLTRQIDSKFGRVDAVASIRIEQNATQTVQNQPSAPTSASNALQDKINNYLQRIEIFIGDSDWQKANEYAEKILDEDPKNAQAYLMKAFCDHKVSSFEQLVGINGFEKNSNYEKAIKFSDGRFKDKLENAIRSKEYNIAMNLMKGDITHDAVYNQVRMHLEKARGYKDAEYLYRNLKNEKDLAEKRKNYDRSARYTDEDLLSPVKFKQITDDLTRASGYKDADELREQAKNRREMLLKEVCYKDAVSVNDDELINDSTFARVKANLEKASGYKDADALLANLDQKRNESIKRNYYMQAQNIGDAQLLDEVQYEQKLSLLKNASGYKDADELYSALPKVREKQIKKQYYDQACEIPDGDLIVDEEYDRKVELLKKASGYKNADKILSRLPTIREELEISNRYDVVLSMIQTELGTADEEYYEEIQNSLKELNGYKDSNELLQRLPELREEAIRESEYDRACNLMDYLKYKNSYNEAQRILEELGDYKECKRLLAQLPQKRSKAKKDAFAKGFKDSMQSVVKFLPALATITVLTAVLAGIIALLFVIFKWPFNWTVAQWLSSIAGGIAFVLPIAVCAFLPIMDGTPNDSDYAFSSIFIFSLAILNLLLQIINKGNYAIICYGYSIVLFFTGIAFACLEPKKSVLAAAPTSLLAVVAVVVAIDNWTVGQWFVAIPGSIAIILLCIAICRYVSNGDYNVDFDKYAQAGRIINIALAVVNVILLVVLPSWHKVVFVGISSTVVINSLIAIGVSSEKRWISVITLLATIVCCVLGLIFF